MRLTHEPSSFAVSDIDALRGHGFDDESIHDAFQIVGYFAYINRVCDGLGVDPEDFMPPKPAGWDRAHRS